MIPESTQESRLVASIEDQLGLNVHSSIHVENLLRRHFVGGGRIHRRAVLKVERDLGLPPSQVLTSIYDVLSVTPDYIDAKTLLFFYICLAQGSREQKAQQIWTLFDPEATDFASPAVIKEIYQISIRCATDLVAFAVKAHEGFAEERLNKWREDLRNRKEKCIEQFTSHFLLEADGIPKPTYLAIFMTNADLDFTNLLNVRTQIEKVQFVQFAAKSAFANFKKP